MFENILFTDRFELEFYFSHSIPFQILQDRFTACFDDLLNRSAFRWCICPQIKDKTQVLNSGSAGSRIIRQGLQTVE